MKTEAVVPMELNNSHLPGKNAKPFTSGLPFVHVYSEPLGQLKT